MTMAAQRLAAMELGLIGCVGNVLSVWAVSRVTAVESEVLLGAVHTFVPLQTMLLGRTAAERRVGHRTLAGCGLAFVAAFTSITRCSGSVTPAAAGGAVAGKVMAKATAGGCAFASRGALVAAAALYSLGKVRLQHHVVDHGDAERLNCARMVWMAFFSLGGLALDTLLGGASRSLALSGVSVSQWAVRDIFSRTAKSRLLVVDGKRGNGPWQAPPRRC